MTKLEKILYTAKVHTTGGRDGGASRTDDGRLQITLTQYSLATSGNIDVKYNVLTSVSPNGASATQNA